jgi:hypothetical protein
MPACMHRDFYWPSKIDDCGLLSEAPPSPSISGIRLKYFHMSEVKWRFQVYPVEANCMVDDSDPPPQVHVRR